MKTYDIQKTFFNSILNDNKDNSNKDIYNELVFYRFFEVIKSTFPIYSQYKGDKLLEKQIKEFISFGSKTSYVWKISLEFKDYLFLYANISNLEKQILIFEKEQIKIYVSNKSIKSKKISYKRAYRLSHNCYIQKHTFDIENRTFKKTEPTYYLIFKNIDDLDVYYIAISKFLYYFFKYQKSNNTIFQAIKLASKRVNLNYKDVKDISLDTIRSFIQNGILI